MVRFIFLICAAAALFVMGGIHFLIRKEGNTETSFCSPLERGFACTGKVCAIFSLQLFTILVLFLIFDIEVVLIVALILGGTCGKFVIF